MIKYRYNRRLGRVLEKYYLLPLYAPYHWVTLRKEEMDATQIEATKGAMSFA